MIAVGFFLLGVALIWANLDPFASGRSEVVQGTLALIGSALLLIGGAYWLWQHT